MQVVVLASGTGSNFRAICEAVNQGELALEIQALITDKKNIGALQIAEEFGIQTIVLEYQAYRSRDLYNGALEKTLAELKPDLICLAGYMRIVNREIIQKYKGKIINIHPSLLPKFPGLHAIEQAVAAEEIQTGVTTHYVDEGMDTGPIIQQVSFPIADLSLEEIYTKLKPYEHKLYIDTLKEIIEE